MKKQTIQGSGALKLIVLGLFISAFQLNFWKLQYILPTIGILLQFTGYRSLRKENTYFGAAWLIAAARMVYWSIYLGISATPAIIIWNQSEFLMGCGHMVVQILQLLLLSRALEQRKEEQGWGVSVQAIKGLVVVQCVFILVIVLELNESSILTIGLLVYQLIVFYKVFAMVDELRMANNWLIITEKRVSDRQVYISYFVVMPTIVVALSVMLSRIPVQASIYNEPELTGNREELLALGFPSNVLDDLSDRNVEVFSHPIRVEVTTNTQEFNYEEEEKTDNCTLECTSIFVELSDHSLYIIEYFEYPDNLEIFQDGFVNDCYETVNLVDGALLYEIEDTTFITSIPRLSDEEKYTEDWMYGRVYEKRISGAISYPSGAAKKRGYVLGKIQRLEVEKIVSHYMSYAHSKSRFQFPYAYIEDEIRNGREYPIQIQTIYDPLEE